MVMDVAGGGFETERRPSCSSHSQNKHTPCTRPTNPNQTQPTGVEFSGEFVDFLDRDLKKFYPRLVDLVSFKIVQAGPSVRARSVVVGGVCLGFVHMHVRG